MLCYFLCVCVLRSLDAFICCCCCLLLVVVFFFGGGVFFFSSSLCVFGRGGGGGTFSFRVEGWWIVSTVANDYDSFRIMLS